MKPVLFAALFACVLESHADEIQTTSTQTKAKEVRTVDVRRVLESGKMAKTLPQEVVIRIGACLGESDEKASGARIPVELRETWEFASTQVHRVVFEYGRDKSTFRRVESRPFDSKGICKELLESNAIEIQAKKGEGPEAAFMGTRYHRGSRSIEVVWNGETILHLLETNGATLALYRESDARAFGALYERLAKQARAAFEKKAR